MNARMAWWKPMGRICGVEHDEDGTTGRSRVAGDVCAVDAGGGLHRQVSMTRRVHYRKVCMFCDVVVSECMCGRVGAKLVRPVVCPTCQRQRFLAKCPELVC
jgi:hypothetical protein